MCWQRKQPSIASIQMTLQANKGPRNLAPLIVGSFRSLAGRAHLCQQRSGPYMCCICSFSTLQLHQFRRLGLDRRRGLTKILNWQKGDPETATNNMEKTNARTPQQLAFADLDPPHRNLVRSLLIALCNYQAMYSADSLERIKQWSNFPRNVRVGKPQAGTFDAEAVCGVGFLLGLDSDRRLEGNAEKESA